jgi:hypothetical protein
MAVQSTIHPAGVHHNAYLPQTILISMVIIGIAAALFFGIPASHNEILKTPDGYLQLIGP